MGDAGGSEDLHRFTNDIGTPNLPRVGHESKTSPTGSLDERSQVAAWDRLIADQSDANDAFGRERDIQGSLIGRIGRSSDQFNEPGDRHPELVLSALAAGRDSLEPRVARVQA